MRGSTAAPAGCHWRGSGPPVSFRVPSSHQISGGSPESILWRCHQKSTGGPGLPAVARTRGRRRSDPNIRSAIPAREADLVRPHRARWFFAEVDEEVFVDGQAAVRVAVELHQVGAILAQVGVELV